MRILLLGGFEGLKAFIDFLKKKKVDWQLEKRR
jgi:hypothetical protein